MPIQIINVGQKAPSWCDLAIKEYQKRLSGFTGLTLTNIPISPWHKKQNPQKAMEEEGKHILSHIKPHDFMVVLDEKGKSFSSQLLAEKLNHWQQDAKKLVFVIGGPTGLSDAVKKQAQLKWSLSDLTFPHKLVLILLIEQLYRAYSIQHNHPYHKI